MVRPYCLCGNNMPLLLLVKSGNALDCHVVRFCCSGSEDDVFRVSTDQIRDMLQGGIQLVMARR